MDPLQLWLLLTGIALAILAVMGCVGVLALRLLAEMEGNY